MNLSLDTFFAVAKTTQDKRNIYIKDKVHLKLYQFTNFV